MYVYIHVYIFICVQVGAHVYADIYIYMGLESRGQLQSNAQKGYVSPLRHGLSLAISSPIRLD